MKRLLRWLVGVRDDLNLSQRWWHRLMIVAFILATIALGLLVGILSYQQPALRHDNIVVVARLGEYTTRHPEMANTIPSFAALGRVAFESSSGDLGDFLVFESEYFCSANLNGYPREVAAFLRQVDAVAYRDMDAERAARWLREHQAVGEVGNCITRNSEDRPTSSRIIAYRFATHAVGLGIAHAVLWAVGAALVWSLIALNAYYHGLVYIIFGSRRRRAEEMRKGRLQGED